MRNYGLISPKRMILIAREGNFRRALTLINHPSTMLNLPENGGQIPLRGRFAQMLADQAQILREYFPSNPSNNIKLHQTPQTTSYNNIKL